MSASSTTPSHQLVAADTAVVLIEFQNDFCSEGGVLYEAVKASLQDTKMIENTTSLVKELREKGVTILHAPITFSDDYRELTSKPYGILKGVVDGKAFKKSAWGGEIIKELTPVVGAGKDIVIQGKTGLDCFHSTNLDFILRSRGFKNVAICGLLTNCCVESTMRSAYEKGWNVFTLTDCCAATSVAAHNAAVEYTFPMFSHPTKAKEFQSFVK